MLIMELAAQEGGGRRNQDSKLPIIHVPEGYVVIPAALEEKARALLPFVTLVFEGDKLVDVEPGEPPGPAAETEPDQE